MPGIAITLQNQYDYNEDAVLILSDHKCSVYLLADSNLEDESYIQLGFQGVQCSRSARTECTPAMGIYPKTPSDSCIVELTKTNWSAEVREKYVYATSSIEPRGKHYVVSNHDVFHEVLADSFSEKLIKKGDENYDFIKSLFSPN